MGTVTIYWARSRNLANGFLRNKWLLSPFFVLAVAWGTPAQESLEAILDRGYVAHWLVCGPFAPDVAGGIAAALQRGEAPLGNQDYMGPIGGIHRLRPKHLDRVRGTEPAAIWQQAGTKDESLDLSPFYPDKKEGVSYSAFWTKVDRQQTVYFDLQTPLGARAWLNGFIAREIRAVPLRAAGVDRFVAELRPGLNLMVIETPGVAYEQLAMAAGMTVRELRTLGFANRPLLKGKSGFEIALKLRACQPLGDLFYITPLEYAGTLSGTVADVRQDMWLTLFNPADKHSQPVDVMVQAPTLLEPFAVRTPPIPPRTAWKERLRIPTGDTLPGRTVNVTLGLSTGDSTTTFETAVKVEPKTTPGRVYVVTGQGYAPEAPEDQATESARRNVAMVRQLLLTETEPEFGVDLGTTTQWRPALTGRPTLLPHARKTVGLARSAPRAGFSRPDERVVCGETLLRNLQYGLASGRALLGADDGGYYAWDMPGIAAQTPQILTQLGLSGIVSNLELAGLPGLSHHFAPDGTAVFHRRKQSAPGPATLDELLEMTALQRRELLGLGIPADVLVPQSIAPPPEPFYHGTAAQLAQSFPQVLVEGRGGRSFLDELRMLPEDTAAKIPHTARAMTVLQPGSVAAQSELKQAHGQLEGRLLAAESYATLASLCGAQYPGAALDAAWRQVLYWSTPERLGVAPLANTYIDTMAGLRDAAELTDEVYRKSTEYLAGLLDTSATAPVNREGLQALTVFNPCSWDRTDLCEVVVSVPPAPGLTLFDDEGKEVPFLADRLRLIRERFVRGARLRFVAQDVPSLGCRTYYLAPRGTLPQTTSRDTYHIENEFFEVTVEPATGDIVSLVDKRNREQLAVGSLNHVAALALDPSRMDGGRELWTTGGNESPASEGISTRCTVTEWMEYLQIEIPFQGGTLVKELALYQGVPRLDCSLTLDGVPLANKLLTVNFKAPQPGRALVLGQPFGAAVARRSRGTQDFRTRGIDNPSGTGAQPALQWAALSPGDQIRIGTDTSLPLGPAAIIHGKDSMLLRGSRALMKSWAGRGIPASIWADTPPDLDFLWTDSTEFHTPNEDLDHGTAMRIVVGGPGQNRYCEALLERLPETARTAIVKGTAQGIVALVRDTDVPEGYAPVPTLVVADFDAQQSSELAERIAESIRNTGEYAIPSTAVFTEDHSEVMDSGLAVLYPGARLCSMERDGALVMILGHGVRPKFAESEASLLPRKYMRRTYRYALYPFSGTWRSAALPRAARALNQPLGAVLAGVHGGQMPARQSFLRPTDPEYLVTSLMPSGIHHAAYRGTTPHPRNGFLVRGYESVGEPRFGSLEFFLPLNDTRKANRFGEAGAPIQSEEMSFPFEVGGFRLASHWVLPNTRQVRGKSLEIARTKSPYGAIHTKYWLHNAGAAPLGNLPVSVVLEGQVTENATTLDAIVSNNLSGRAAEGVLYLRGSEDWNVGTPQFYYNLSPGETMIKQIPIPQGVSESTTAGLEAWTHYAGQTYRDVIERHPAPLSMSVSRTESQVKVSIENLGGIPAEGFLDLVTPPAYWPELGNVPAVTAMPRRAAVSVPPFDSQDVLFRFSRPEDIWAVAKLAANGHVLYQAVPGKTPIPEVQPNAIAPEPAVDVNGVPDPEGGQGE